jgi:hypothetical protein
MEWRAVYDGHRLCFLIAIYSQTAREMGLPATEASNSLAQ